MSLPAEAAPAASELAQALLAARTAHRPADAESFAAHLASPADAYLVQDLVFRQLDGGTGFPRHWKSGGPSRSALTHAPLPAPAVWPSPADARAWPFVHRLIEVEIALRLAGDVSPAQAAALSHEDAFACVDAMTVSIEIVDFRWQQAGTAPTLLKLADLQSHGALVLGAWVPFERRDWSAQTGSVSIGSQPAQAFCGTHSLGDPAWVLPGWLRHATRGGQAVPAGTVVTTGTWCGMPAAAAGDRVVARFDGIGETLVQL